MRHVYPLNITGTRPVDIDPTSATSTSPVNGASCTPSVIGLRAARSRPSRFRRSVRVDYILAWPSGSTDGARWPRSASNPCTAIAGSSTAGVKYSTASPTTAAAAGWHADPPAERAEYPTSNLVIDVIRTSPRWIWSAHTFAGLTPRRTGADRSKPTAHPQRLPHDVVVREISEGIPKRFQIIDRDSIGDRTLTRQRATQVLAA